VLKTLRPFLNLAEKLGRLQSQLAEGAINRLEVNLKGEPIIDHTKPLTIAILKGILDPILDETVNYVNAPHLAEQRGITLVSQNTSVSSDYANLISCRVAWDGGSHTVSGTLFNHDEPRIVGLDGYRIDVLPPEGNILVTHSWDKPGFIGQVGTILGQHNINIATWRTGRTGPGGLAISFIRIDEGVPDEVIAALEKVDLIRKVQTVQF
jgi:D-3-phosphoglycerate dehydrogenase